MVGTASNNHAVIVLRNTSTRLPVLIGYLATMPPVKNTLNLALSVYYSQNDPAKQFSVS